MAHSYSGRLIGNLIQLLIGTIFGELEWHWAIIMHHLAYPVLLFLEQNWIKTDPIL